MRPFLEMLISKDSRTNASNSKKEFLFGAPLDAPLNARMVNFRFEESDGDDIEKNRKGRKDIVTFTFLDQTSEVPGFISDTGLIEVDDVLYIRYGWIAGPNNTKIQPDLKEREFKVVKIQPKLTGTLATVTVTAFDRSIDLDRAAVHFIFSSAQGSSSSAGLTPFKVVLNSIAQSQGLELDQSSRVIFEDDILLGSKLAVPHETLASYLKFLAEETGSIYFVENRRLFFGARKIPNDRDIAAVLVRGSGKSFDFKSRQDLREVPIIDISFERKIPTDSLKYTVQSQEKRSAQLSVEETLANELSQILLITGEFDDALTSPAGGSGQVAISVPIKGLENTSNVRGVRAAAELRALERRSAFFKQPRLFKEEDFSSDILNLSPTLREEKIKSIAQKKLTDLALKEVTGSVKIPGNPLIRHGNLVTVTGNVPASYRGNWYVQTVEHIIDGGNYFTNLTLMAASPDNPFVKDKLKKFGKKIQASSSKKGKGRDIVPVRTAR